MIFVRMFEKEKKIFTLDEDRLIRVWDLLTGLPDSTVIMDCQKEFKLTCAALDQGERKLAVANENAEVFVHNFFSGGRLFDLKR